MRDAAIPQADAKRQRPVWRAPFLVLALGLGLTVAGIAVIGRAGRAADQRQFERQSDAMWQAFRNMLAQQQGLVQGTALLCIRYLDQPSDALTGVWKARVVGNRLTHTYPGFHECGLAMLTEPADRTVSAGFGLDAGLIPTVRELWVRQSGAIDPTTLRWGDEDLRAIRLAWRTGSPQATPKIELSPMHGRPQRGFRVYYPLLDRLQDPDGPRPRGVVFASFFPERLLAVFFGRAARPILLEIHDEDAAGDGWMTEPQVGADGLRDVVEVMEAEAPLRVRRKVEVLGRTWTLDFRSTAEFVPTVSRRLWWAAGGVGAFFTLGAAALTGWQVRRQAEAEIRGRRWAEQRRAAWRRDALLAQTSERRFGEVESRLAAAWAKIGPWVDRTGERDTALSGISGEFDVVRGVIADGWLRIGPVPGEARSFRSAVAAWLARVEGTNSCSATIEGDVEFADMPGAEETRAALALVLREAVGNAVRHGRARRVAAIFRVEHGRVVLLVHDDGLGMEPLAPERHGRGWRTLATVATELGGSWTVESRPGGPTTVRVAFPLGSASTGLRDAVLVGRELGVKSPTQAVVDATLRAGGAA